MISLILCQRPSQGTGAIVNITSQVSDWRRTIRAVGGYWQGSFTYKASVPDLQRFFEEYLGCTLKEYADGLQTWEGLIYEMRLVQGGREYTRTLDPEWCHNRVKVLYGNAGDAVNWAGNADSIAQYGTLNYLVTVGASTDAAGTALQSRHLREFAWPRTRLTGGVTANQLPQESSADSLSVTVAGYWVTLNWGYYESYTSGTASNLVSTLAGSAQWVTAGRVETNTLSVVVDGESVPQRIGDLIEGIVQQGDASGNVWLGGVYNGRGLVYEPAGTVVSAYLVGNRLTDLAGRLLQPAQVRPGLLVRNLSAPSGHQPAGTAGAWDDPRVAYVDEVEYLAADGLRLRFAGSEEGVNVLLKQLEGWEE